MTWYWCLKCWLKDVEEALQLQIEVLDGERVDLFDVFVDKDKLDVDVDVVVEVLFAEEAFVLVQLEELLVGVLLALDDEVLVDIAHDEPLELVVDYVHAAKNRQCQDGDFELRSTLELCHCASLALNSCDSSQFYKNAPFEKQYKLKKMIYNTQEGSINFPNKNSNKRQTKKTQEKCKSFYSSYVFSVVFSVVFHASVFPTVSSPPVGSGSLGLIKARRENTRTRKGEREREGTLENTETHS